MGQQQRLLKGLFKDSGEIDQPSNTWRYALNALMNDQKGTVSNESGTTVEGVIPCEDCNSSENRNNTHEYKVIGAVEIDLNRTVLFIADSKAPIQSSSDIALDYYPRNLIALWDGVKNPTQAVSILYQPVTSPSNQDGYQPFDLNFKEDNPIEGTFRIDSKEDIVVYWTDDLNPPRAFNVSRQLRELDTTGQTKWLYGIDPKKTHSKHINLLNLFPSSGPIPTINSRFQDPSLTTIGQGGGLLTGVYYLALAYVDEDFVSTNYLTVSNPVSIVPAFTHTRPTTKKDGAMPGTQTSKSITWNVQNINTDYKYLKAAIIRKKGDASEVFKLTDKVITGDMTLFTNNMQITFAGTEGFEPLKMEDVMVDTVGYDTAKTITQMDNVLYLGNLTGSPDLGYQKYANNIKLNAHKTLIEGFDTVILSMDNLYSGFANSQVDSMGSSSTTIDDSLSYRDIDKSTYHRGYRRGEVYAFYIAFILNDGSMSYAYHIPGREPIKPSQCWPDLYGGTYGGSTARTDYEYWGIPSGMTNPAVDHQKSLHPGVKSFHFYDCSGYSSGSDANSRSGGGTRHMRYWHNLNETYSDTDNSHVWDRSTYITTSGVLVSPVSGLYNTVNFQTKYGYKATGLHGMNVRHHHMPSNNNEWAVTVEPGEVGGAIEATTVVPADGGIFTGSFRTRTNASEWWMSDSYSQTRSCKGTGPLGAAMNFVYTGVSTNADPVPYSNSANKFTAIEDNTVVIAKVNTRVYNDNNGCSRSHSSRIRYKVTASSSTQTAASQKIEVGTNDWKTQSYTTPQISLMIGGTMWMDSKGDQGGTWAGGCPHKGPDCGSAERHIRYSNNTSSSYIQWNVEIGAGNSALYDVRLSQDVNILGISLEDINIPKTYANKIQGFRIYYAKRDFANKRMLGQSTLIPMKADSGRTGVCAESVLNSTNQGIDATDQLLSISTTGAEPWISKEAWAYDPSTYPVNASSMNHQNTPSVYNVGSSTWTKKDGAYKYFSFYDFNMLREHHSISGATHIDVIYVVNNWVWNGPSLQQDKKMLSELDASTVGVLDVNSDTGLYKITERWGWDDSGFGGPQNCYAKDITSAMFAGGAYITAKKFMGTSYTLSRLISQKAKTYLAGDSVLLAKPLGFSGKLINTFGDSTIAFALKDKVELPALYSSQDGLLGLTYFVGAVTNNVVQSIWGTPPAVSNNLMTLANPMLASSRYTGVLSTETETEDDATSNLSYIANMCAFRTDVYRSVDNQELIYTGFQVVGTDLDNFFFDDERYITDLNNPASNNYGQLKVNSNFGNQWRRDVIVFGSTVTLNIVDSTGSGGAATAVLNTFGELISVTITAAGSAYSADVDVQAIYLGSAVGDWLTFTVTLTAGNITSIVPVYTANTFKIETGECANWCSLPNATWLDQQGCETGNCYKSSTSQTPVEDDEEGFTGGATPITNQAECNAHGYGKKIEISLSGATITSYIGLDATEFGNRPGTALYFFNFEWKGGGGTYTNDCGGIYGGDTFIARQGISTGAAVLEEHRPSNPLHAIHYHIVESEDNINFRHMENKDSAYYPESVATDVLQSIGSTIDPNSEENIKYDANFSALNDVRTAFPLPVKNTDRSTYPTRTIRSTRNDASGIIDNYRIWLANQFRDLPKNRGELWKLSTFNNLIYFHMESSLFKAAGKQTMQMGDGSDAYVGSGDIFKQEPSEIVQTKDGYGGTQSQYAALTTRYGYFFVDRKGKKVFMMKDTLLEISALGMENWFIDNMNYALIAYGATELDKVDNPIMGLGYHSVWDPYNKRIILTKRDIEPTAAFIAGFYLSPGGGGQTQPGKVKWSSSRHQFIRYYSVKAPKGGYGYSGWAPIAWSDDTYFIKGGWTISYYPDQAVWCSFHSYVPYIYFNTTETFYSVTDKFHNWEGAGIDSTYSTAADFMMATGSSVGNKGIWGHNNGQRGLYYQDNLYKVVITSIQRDYWTWQGFELEVIQNTLKGFDTVTSSIAYMLDVTNEHGVRVLEHGFTNFYVYNTFQISGDETSSALEYLVNVRRIGNDWKINRFRDLSLDVLRGPAGPQVDPYYMSPNTNITGGLNVGTTTTSHLVPMFVKIGMREIVSPLYLDLAKTNLRRRKFIDKWIGIRLFYDNITNNLLNLYSTSVESRKMYR